MNPLRYSDTVCVRKTAPRSLIRRARSLVQLCHLVQHTVLLVQAEDLDSGAWSSEPKCEYLQLLPNLSVRRFRSQADGLSGTHKVSWMSCSGVDDPTVCLTNNH